VLAVTSGQRLGFVPVENWLAKVPPDGWRRLSAGDGAKGPRLYDWAYLPYRGAAPGWRMGLLVRRSPAKPGELAGSEKRTGVLFGPARRMEVLPLDHALALPAR
jgi:hypothetical protein